MWAGTLIIFFYSKPFWYWNLAVIILTYLRIDESDTLPFFNTSNKLNIMVPDEMPEVENS